MVGNVTSSNLDARANPSASGVSLADTDSVVKKEMDLAMSTLRDPVSDLAMIFSPRYRVLLRARSVSIFQRAE